MMIKSTNNNIQCETPEIRFNWIIVNQVLFLRQISEQSWNKIKALSTSREDRTDLV